MEQMEGLWCSGDSLLLQQPGATPIHWPCFVTDRADIRENLRHFILLFIFVLGKFTYCVSAIRPWEKVFVILDIKTQTFYIQHLFSGPRVFKANFIFQSQLLLPFYFAYPLTEISFTHTNRLLSERKHPFSPTRKYCSTIVLKS